MVMLLFRSGSGLCRSIVPVTPKAIVNLSEWLPASAIWIAARSVPGPESASELTVRLTCEGSQRSSSASSLGRQLGRLRWKLRPRGAEPECFANQEENHMMLLLSRDGPQQNEEPAPSARRPSAGAWPMRQISDLSHQLG